MPSIPMASAASRTFTKHLEYDDTWCVALGAPYRFAPRWLWSVGTACGRFPVDDDARTPDLPLDRQVRLGTGIQYDWIDAVDEEMLRKANNGKMHLPMPVPPLTLTDTMAAVNDTGHWPSSIPQDPVFPMTGISKSALQTASA